MWGASALPTISPAAWFSNQIQITCETCAGVPVRVPQTLRACAAPPPCAAVSGDDDRERRCDGGRGPPHFWPWRENVWRSTRRPVTTIVRR